MQSSWTNPRWIPSAHAALNGKSLLTKSDFKYVGSFVAPDMTDAYYSVGFALRQVNGAAHGFVVGFNPSHLYEYAIPTPSLTAPYPEAQVLKDWGPVSGGKATFDPGDSNFPSIAGIFWDETDHRLYWNYLDGYNAVFLDNPSIGYSTLNDATGVATSFGAWRFTGRGTKMTDSCVVPLPDWFSALPAIGGKSLGVGCGGYRSTGSGTSIGPALTAINPPNPAVNPELSSLPYTNLVGYPGFNSPDYTSPARSQRDTDYYDAWAGWNPKNGIGYWVPTDSPGASVWIDLPTKSGLFYFPTLTKGRSWYYNAALSSQLTTHWWYQYDPADLLGVAQGTKEQDQIQSAATWPASYPNFGYITEGQAGGSSTRGVNGAAFDPTNRLLYVSVGASFGKGQAMIHVYQVGDNIAPPVPPVTTAPHITLSASPTSLPDIPTGNGNGSTDTTWLSWYVDDAVSVTLSPGVGPVAKSDTLAVKPNGTTTYTLSATNAVGTTTEHITVTVNGVTPTPTGATRDRANSYDDGWESAWIHHGKTLLAGIAGKTTGFVLHIGDSITHARPYSEWAVNGQGKTAEDLQLTAWSQPTAWGATAPDGTIKNGWYLAGIGVTGRRSMTAASGMTLQEFISGSGNGDIGSGDVPMPSVTDTVQARQIIADPMYYGNLQIDTLAAAFRDAQAAVVMLGTNEANRSDNIANLTKVIDKLEALHILPVLSTVPPQSDAVLGPAAIQLNTAIRQLAQSRALPLIDLYQEILLRRPGTTWLNTLISDDGIHPTAAGAGFESGSDPYAPGGDPSVHETGDAALNVGYLLRDWLTVQKLKELKANVIDTLGTPPSPTPPTISAHPQAATVPAGQPAGFSVTASGGTAYQWQKAPSGSSNFLAISGATSASYTTPATVDADNDSRFRCVVTNAAGSVTSNSATLTVTPPGTGPAHLNLLTPTPGSSITGGDVAVAYYSTGDLADVTSVKFQLDANPVVGRPSLSGTYTFTGVPAGSHTLKAYLADAGGSKISGTEIAVTFTTQAGGSAPETLPTPTLNLPSYIPVNGTLTVGYPSGFADVGFQWTLFPKDGTNALVRARSIAVPAPSSFQSAGNVANLGSYSLAPGIYTVSVQAFKAGGAQSLAAQQDNVTLVSANFSGVRVYPNPWRRDKHAASSITFDHLPLNSTIKLFTVSGRWVKSLTPGAGTLTAWDLTNDKGDKVASGIYLYVIQAGDEKMTGQAHVIR